MTFLTSNWRCIWDEGCLGVRASPTPEAAEGCCSFGAHFTDDAERERIGAVVPHLTAEDWQFHGHEGPLFSQDDDGDWQTALHQNACVFLNRPGFAGGHGCALHRAALRTGNSIVEWKPDVCWQLPVRLEYHTDENGHEVNTVRQWSRNDWGEGGQDFGWWCTEDDLAFRDHTPVYQRHREELVGLVGEAVTDLLFDHLDRRGTEHLLPHPVLRRRP